MLSFCALTNARYFGQGLEPQFFRFTSNSDIFSNALFFFTLFFLVRGLLHSVRISTQRIIILVVSGFIIFWITLGAKNFEVGEFPRIASITFILLRAAYLSLLIPRKEYQFSKIMGAIRVLKNTLIVFASAVLFTFVFTFTYEVTSDFNDMRRFDADGGVILGAAVWHGNEHGERASPTLAERIRVGAELIHQNVVPKLVTTGSNAIGEKAESEIAKSELIGKGVDETKITAETKSHSTLSQILYMRNELMTKQGWKKFIVVSDQYHLARVLEMCKFNGLDAIGTPSGIKQPALDLAYYRLRESVALLAYWILGK